MICVEPALSCSGMTSVAAVAADVSVADAGAVPLDVAVASIVASVVGVVVVAVVFARLQSTPLHPSTHTQTYTSPASVTSTTPSITSTASFALICVFTQAFPCPLHKFGQLNHTEKSFVSHCDPT